MFKQIILLLLIITVINTQEDKIEAQIKACSSDMDCKDAAYPFCSILFKDTTATPPKISGMCSQCRDDCDCGVNQYCATRIPISKDTFKPAKGTTGLDYAFNGLTVPGVCRAYGQSDTEKASKGLGKNGASALNGDCKSSGQQSQNMKVLSSPDSCKNQVQTGWTQNNFKQAQDSTYFCGALASQFNSNENGWAGSNNKGLLPAVAMSGDKGTPNAVGCASYNKAALVIPSVYKDGASVVAGKSFVAQAAMIANNGAASLPTGGKSFSGGKFDLGEGVGQLYAKTFDWEGYCDAGKCKACQSGTTKCEGSRGQAQVCYHGAWVPATGRAAGQAWTGIDSSIIGGVTGNALLLSILMFFVFMFMVMCVCGCLSAYKKKKEAEAKGETVTFKTFVMTPAK